MLSIYVTSHLVVLLTHLPPAMCGVLPFFFFFFVLILPPLDFKGCLQDQLRFDGQIRILPKKEVRFTSLLQETAFNHRPENSFYRSISVEVLENLASADVSASFSLSVSFENYIYLFSYLGNVHWNLAVTLTGIGQNVR